MGVNGTGIPIENGTGRRDGTGIPVPSHREMSPVYDLPSHPIMFFLPISVPYGRNSILPSSRPHLASHPIVGYFLPSHHFPSRWQDNLSRPTCFPSHYPRTPVPMTIVDMLLPLSVPIFLPFALPTQPPKSPICTSHLRVVSQFQWKLYFIFINIICEFWI